MPMLTFLEGGLQRSANWRVLDYDFAQMINNWQPWIYIIKTINHSICEWFLLFNEFDIPADKRCHHNITSLTGLFYVNWRWMTFKIINVVFILWILICPDYVSIGWALAFSAWGLLILPINIVPNWFTIWRTPCRWHPYCQRATYLCHSCLKLWLSFGFAKESSRGVIFRQSIQASFIFFLYQSCILKRRKAFDS